jgi:hypothetical protein
MVSARVASPAGGIYGALGSRSTTDDAYIQLPPESAGSKQIVPYVDGYQTLPTGTRADSGGSLPSDASSVSSGARSGAKSPRRGDADDAL